MMTTLMTAWRREAVCAALMSGATWSCVELTLLACLMSLGVNVAKAQDTGTVTIRYEDTTCFIYTIAKFPFDQEALNGRAAETWVRWCAKSNPDTGQLGTVTGNSISCAGEGDEYFGCSSKTTESNDSSFTINTVQVFCPLSVWGGCLWQVYQASVRFDASGAVTLLEVGFESALSGPPSLGGH
jgi:hypothetical protein